MLLYKQILYYVHATSIRTQQFQQIYLTIVIDITIIFLNPPDGGTFGSWGVKEINVKVFELAPGACSWKHDLVVKVPGGWRCQDTHVIITATPIGNYAITFIALF